MTHKQTIQQLANNLLIYFDQVYIDAEIVSTDDKKFPAVSLKDEWVNLTPTDQKEIVYIRRNGDDEVSEKLNIGGCIKSYRMRTPLRIVFFKDHVKNQNKILSDLMQSVLMNGTKLNRIIRDKWKLQRDESSGNYNFGPTTVYFAVDIYALWNLIPDTCEEDFCIEIENPLCKQ